MGTAPSDDTFPSHLLDLFADARPTSGDSTDGLAHLNGSGDIRTNDNSRVAARPHLFVFLL